MEQKRGSHRRPQGDMRRHEKKPTEGQEQCRFSFFFFLKLYACIPSKKKFRRNKGQLPLVLLMGVRIEDDAVFFIGVGHDGQAC